ncbi:hypothetical protein ACSGEQ_10370 [Klebsiella pneumoniae]|uniref:hypothetical protein n=1 Tax=Klebsiella pneumoniae complex TaxID=3390273 RepID=UPI001620018C|nr:MULTISPECIES: hypothetical protein [Klebsiella]HCB1065416.1 hypothetical protein [Klebsiella variicola subsp. variicola]MCH9452562.1 hypothetical protein [Klebsiella pneumoniae]QNC78734.1 hypothetical protein F3137_09150 [Klebsiella quasipneumoniae]GKN72028.1 hypothetical protein NUKP86_44740 [Klebsiella variicola]HCI8818287.1 hypothetical protein [Klebsiella variicola]
MSAMEKWDDEAFILAMSEVIPEQEMTHELAAQEAIADHLTERQSERMGMYECL